MVEPSTTAGGGFDLVRYDAATGVRDVLVGAIRLTAEGQTGALPIDDYAWSADATKLLVFANTKKVWRDNTRGDYWVLDRDTGGLRKLGGKAPESTLMFAKFSPDGSRVGYVRYDENDIYVEDLASGEITQLTTDGSRTIINGTFDWVYEEELNLQDGWRWSPDGQRIAYWQLDASGVGEFLLLNSTDSLYSFTVPIQIVRDHLVEGNETFHIVLVDAVNATIDPDHDTAMVTIFNDDLPPLAQNDTYTVAEGGNGGALFSSVLAHSDAGESVDDSPRGPNEVVQFVDLLAHSAQFSGLTILTGLLALGLAVGLGRTDSRRSPRSSR